MCRTQHLHELMADLESMQHPTEQQGVLGDTTYRYYEIVLLLPIDDLVLGPRGPYFVLVPPVSVMAHLVVF